MTDQPIFRPAYAGIGSRQTPADVQKLMHHLAVTLAKQGWILRSGGAPGADQAFLSGAIDVHTHQYHAVETYLPWASFEKEALSWLTVGSRSHVALDEPAMWTMPIASEFYTTKPWSEATPGVQRLMARNVHQVLGPKQYEPSDQRPKYDVVKMVVCWTKDGKASGGTGQALRIADAFGVEVRNLFDPDTRTRAEAFCAGEMSKERLV